MNDEKMTATEHFRQLLDKRGVEWDYGITGPATTRFNANGVDVTFTPILDGLVCSTILTPEQAVEATLGRGTCDMEFTQAAQFGDPNDEDSIFDVGMFRCTACGTETYGMWNDNDECREWPRYCPNCGRRVVE